MRCFQFAALLVISSHLTSASGKDSVLVTPEGQVQSSQNHVVRKERARIKKTVTKASSIQDYVVDSQGQFTLSNEERLSDTFVGQHPNAAMVHGNSNKRQQHSQQHPTAAVDSMDSVLIRKRAAETTTEAQATTTAPATQGSTTNTTTTAQAEWGRSDVNWLNPLTWFNAPPDTDNTTQAPAAQESTQASTTTTTTTTTTAWASSGWAGWFGATPTQAPTDQASTTQAPAQGGQGGSDVAPSSTHVPPGVPIHSDSTLSPTATPLALAPATPALSTTPAPPPTPPTPAPPPTPSPPPIDMEFGGTKHGVNIDDHDKKHHYTYQTRPEAVKSKACNSNGCKECTEMNTCFHGVTKPWPSWGGAWGFLSVDVPAGGSFTHYTAEVWAHCSSEEGTWWIWSSPDRVSNGILNVFIDGEGGSQEVVKSWSPKSKEDDGQYIELKNIKEGKSRIRVEFYPDLAKGGTAEIWLEASKVDSMVDECMGVKNCLRDVADGTNESFELRNSNDDQMLCLTGATQNMSPALKLKCQEWEMCLTQTKKKEEVLALLQAATMTWDTTTMTTIIAQVPTQAPTQAPTEAATQAPTEAATQTATTSTTTTTTTTQAATSTTTTTQADAETSTMTTTQAPTEAATQTATQAATSTTTPTQAATETSTTTQAPTEAQAATQAATETSTTTTQAPTDSQAATQAATETSTTTTRAPTDTQAATQAQSAEAAPTQPSTQTTTTTQVSTQAASTTLAPTNASQSWFGLLETRRLNGPNDAATSTGDIASRCIDPTTDDPESWDCDCAEVWTEKCQAPQNNGQPLATCLNLVMCGNSRICCSWKQDHCPLQYKCSVGQSQIGASLASDDADGDRQRAMLHRSSASATQKSDTIQETRDHMDDSLMGKCTG